MSRKWMIEDREQRRPLRIAMGEFVRRLEKKRDAHFVDNDLIEVWHMTQVIGRVRRCMRGY